MQSRFFSVLLLIGSALLAAPSKSDLILWYRQPATQWNEALPIGNGRLGAMVFGGVPEERIQLNEDSIWAGEKRDRNNPEGRKSIPEVRRLLMAGKPKEAEELAEKTIISIPKRMPPYQPLGDLRIQFFRQNEVSDYRRDLDLDSALARVSYQSGDVRYTREIFSSAVDQVIVVRLTSDRSGSLSFSVTLARERDAKTRAVNPDRVIMEGEAIPHGERQAMELKVGVKFQAVLQAIPEGGRIRSEGNSLVVEGASAATLLLAAATNFREKDVAARCDQYLRSAKKPYPQLRAAHVADHQRLFRRVEISLPGPTPDLATDERLKRLQSGAEDPQLAALYFQFGRYLLIGSSRPGTMAATLQGIWNDLLEPPLGQQVHDQH